jgi:RNA polymerase sigma-70 factor, ECF subfamily
MSIPINATESGNGPSISLEDLCRNYYDAVKRYVSYHVPSPETVEDLTQETFYKAIRFYPRLRQDAGGAQIYTWLVRVAANAICDYKRSPRSREHLELEAADSLIDEQNGDPYEVCGEDALSGSILYAWRKLSPQQQQMFLLAAEGYRARERAKLLGMKQKEAHVAFKMARRDFKRRYQHYQEQEVA